jgi:hypothetical protein
VHHSGWLYHRAHQVTSCFETRLENPNLAGFQTEMQFHGIDVRTPGNLFRWKLLKLDPAASGGNAKRKIFGTYQKGLAIRQNADLW